VDLYIYSPIRLHGVVLNSLSTGTTLPYTAAKYMILSLYAALIMLFVRTSCSVIHKTLFTCSSDYVSVSNSENKKKLLNYNRHGAFLYID
jgi:hypothetical protein